MSNIATYRSNTNIEINNSSDQDDDNLANNTLKIGYIEIKRGKCEWKTYYGIISGGSFYWYKNQLVSYFEIKRILNNNFLRTKILLVAYLPFKISYHWRWVII